METVVYVDPVFSLVDSKENSLKTIQNYAKAFSPDYSHITDHCSQALYLYKTLLSLSNSLNSWEFIALKTSVDINFKIDLQGSRTFDINIAKRALEKSNVIDDSITKISYQISKLLNFVSTLTIEEYISDPGSLLLKIYFKLLNLKNELTESISIFYTKSKLLIINFELQTFLNSIEVENSVVLLSNDFQQTIESYKDFVSVLISQLDQAVLEKDKDQIQECLSVLNDVEKMYESVRMNFIINEEYTEWESQSQAQAHSIAYEDLHSASTPTTSHTRTFSLSSTTSSLNNHHTTTITEELPYLLQAFDEAKTLEQELSTYQNANLQIKRNSGINQKLNTPKRSSNLQPLAAKNIGFSSPLLNSIYGLHPKQHSNPTTTPASPSPKPNLAPQSFTNELD